MTFAEIVWLTIGILALVFEGWTIWGDDEPQTTLSFMIIRARAVGVWRVLIVMAWSWLTWHWFYEPDALAPYPEDDLAIIITGGLATLIKRTPREKMR